MYAYIKGTQSVLSSGTVSVEACGVGYELNVTTRYLGAAQDGEEVKLFTHLIIREDEHSLYGFATEAERQMFRRLISVSGVGPKAGLAILSAMSLQEIASALLSADSKAFSRVSGIGPKTAGRILLELKDKVDVEEVLGMKIENTQKDGLQNNAAMQAISALISLGFAQSEAAQAVSSVKNLADTVEDLTMMALKRLSL